MKKKINKNRWNIGNRARNTILKYRRSPVKKGIFRRFKKGKYGR